MAQHDYRIRGASTEQDLHGIAALQAANLPRVLAPAERTAQGFVTCEHDVTLLQEMNAPWPHVVATPADSDEVVAYALVMLPHFRERLPVLGPMFDRLQTLHYRGRPLATLPWYVMGQLCVAKAHRGRGLVERLYAHHQTQMAHAFELMVTEIDAANTRSLRAHEKAGCEVIDEYHAGATQWVVVALDLRQADGTR